MLIVMAPSLNNNINMIIYEFKIPIAVRMLLECTMVTLIYISIKFSIIIIILELGLSNKINYQIFCFNSEIRILKFYS